MEPTAGVEYPLQLGASLLGKRAAPEEFCTLRYDFKPASAGRAAQGVLEVQTSNQVRAAAAVARSALQADRNWCPTARLQRRR